MAESSSKSLAKAEKAASLSSWNPFLALRNEVDRAFDLFDNGPWRSPLAKSVFNQMPFAASSESDNAPAVDIVDRDKEYEITAELPGVEEKNVEVALSNGGLVIRGHKEEAKEETKKDYFLSERQFGSFERYFALPEGVDTAKISAAYKNGVLTVKLPKSPEAKAAEQKSPVKAA